MPMLVEPGTSRRGVVRMVQLRLHQGEVVAAEPGERVAGPDRGRNPARDAAQDLIAGGMAQRVVDLLLAIRIEQKHGHHAAPALGPSQSLAQPVERQGAVGQAGQGVV